METSLVLGGKQENLGLCFRERLHSNGFTLRADGIIDTKNAAVKGRAVVLKTFNTSDGPLDTVLDKVEIGASYVTETDKFYGGVKAKKSWSIGKGDIKGTLSFMGEADINTDQEIAKRGRVQLTSKVFNFTDNQDVQFKLGYGHKRIGVSNRFLEGPYGCIRENNWQLATDFKGFWEVKYLL